VGDLSGNCEVDLSDLLIFAGQWLDTDTSREGMVAHWKLDGNADDSVGVNHGTVYGNPVWTVGKVDGALDFDGGDYVDCGNDSSLNLTNNFSISVWLNLEDAEPVLPVCKGNVPAYALGGAYNILCMPGNGIVRFYVRDSNDTYSNYAIAAVPLNQWTHVVGTFSDGIITIYTNGVSEPNISLGTPTIHSNDEPLGIGATGDGSASFFRGTVDDVRIYDRALSEEEAQELMDLATPDPCCADLDDDGNVNLSDFTLLAENWRKKGILPVTINEIHSRPDVKTELVEFVELYNPGATDVNLSGWYFCDGISYQFPPESILPGHGYIVVAQNPAHVQTKFGVSSGLVFGPFEFESSLENDGEKIELCNAYGEEIDQVDYQLGFPWPTVGDSVPKVKPPDGSGHSMQLVNPFLDNDLGGSWRSAYPTPAAHNTAVYADNIPPHIRQVRHSPKAPSSGEVVTITAKVTDPDGIANVTLRYQLVNPGNYISISDGAYPANWTAVAMNDDGVGGDAAAGDDIYTVQLSASLQVHRRLVRYRITVKDGGWLSVRVPYADDPQSNFAYFVYDGVPAWSGAIDPDSPDPDLSEVVAYGTDVMQSLPVYHLITKEQDVVDCQYLPGNVTGQYWGSDYPWEGTLVYDDEVYDHIRYRARGGVWRYSMGKNMWKFDFNRGHYFQARDDYGRRYDTAWDKLNFSACIQQGNYWHRGEQGMFEAVGFRLFNLAGVPAPKTNYLQFRIIDDAAESGVGLTLIDAATTAGKYVGLVLGGAGMYHVSPVINSDDVPRRRAYQYLNPVVANKFTINLREAEVVAYGQTKNTEFGLKVNKLFPLFA